PCGSPTSWTSWGPWPSWPLAPTPAGSWWRPPATGCSGWWARSDRSSRRTSGPPRRAPPGWRSTSAMTVAVRGREVADTDRFALQHPDDPRRTLREADPPPVGDPVVQEPSHHVLDHVAVAGQGGRPGGHVAES